MVRDQTPDTADKLYSGPFEIIKRNKGGACLLKSIDGDFSLMRVPRHRLKPASKSSHFSPPESELDGGDAKLGN